MDDIYSWILSPEIREYLRGHHKPDRMERQALIRMSHRGNTVRPPNALRRGGGRNGRLRNGPGVPRGAGPVPEGEGTCYASPPPRSMTFAVKAPLSQTKRQ